MNLLMRAVSPRLNLKLRSSVKSLQRLSQLR